MLDGASCPGYSRSMRFKFFFALDRVLLNLFVFFLTQVCVFGEGVLPLPRHSSIVGVALAEGYQVYRASANPPPTGGSVPQWELIGPEATLYDSSHRVIGRHVPGPRWSFRDGTRLKGKLPPITLVPAKNPKDLPWLLLRVHGEKGRGLLAKATHVARLDTHGGVAPALPPRNQAQVIKIPYRATYLFLSSSAFSYKKSFGW